MFARAVNQLQQEGGVALAHAGHVDDVQGSARRGRVGDHLLQRRDATTSRGVPAAFAQVDEARDAVARRDPKQLEDLLAARTRRVSDAEPHAERSLGEPAFHQGIESWELGVLQRAMGPAATLVADRGSAGERLVVRDDRPPCTHMADADAIIDEAPALPRGVPGRDWVGPDLQFQRGRHAVVRIVAVALRVLPMRMQIAEPRRHHEAVHVEHLSRLERLDRDGCDPALPDADVARGVQARLRVEHAPAREDEIERLAPRPSPARRERDHGKENRYVGRHHESVRGHAGPYVRAHTARWLVRAPPALIHLWLGATILYPPQTSIPNLTPYDADGEGVSGSSRIVIRVKRGTSEAHLVGLNVVRQ